MGAGVLATLAVGAYSTPVIVGSSLGWVVDVASMAGRERQQMKWMALGVGSLAATWPAEMLGAVVRAVPGGDGSDLVIAASTLGMAALFAPLRRRVRALVDQRFNRARVDAQGTIAGFSHQIRAEVDLDALRRRTEPVTELSVQPCSVSLWLRVPANPS